MATKIYFYIRENGIPTSLDDYSGQEVPALEEGIQNLLNQSDDTDNYFVVDSYNEEETGWGSLTYNECVKGDVQPFPEAWLAKYVGNWWILNDPKEMYPLLPQYGLSPWKHIVEVVFSKTQELPKLAMLPPPTGLERCVAAPSALLTQSIASPDRSPVSIVSSPISENDTLRTELKKYMYRLAKRLNELEEKTDEMEEYNLCKKCWHHANILLMEL